MTDVSLYHTFRLKIYLFCKFMYKLLFKPYIDRLTYKAYSISNIQTCIAYRIYHREIDLKGSVVNFDSKRRYKVSRILTDNEIFEN